MKVTIKATKEELESKKFDLAKAIIGKGYKISKIERSPNEPRSFKLKAADQMFSHWDAKFKKMIDDIKSDISKIIGE